MTDDLSRRYETKKLDLKAALADYLQVHRDFVFLYEVLQRTLEGPESLTPEDIQTVQLVVLDCPLALTVLEEKVERLDAISRELGVFLQELSAPPKAE